MPVPAPLKFDNFVSPRVSTSQPNSRHRGFGTRIYHPHHFHARHHFSDQLGHLYFDFCRRAKTRALSSSCIDSRDNFRMCMAQNKRSPGPHKIDIRPPIGIDNSRPLSFHNKERVTTYGTKCSCGTIHTAGNHLLCCVK